MDELGPYISLFTNDERQSIESERLNSLFTTQLDTIKNSNDIVLRVTEYLQDISVKTAQKALLIFLHRHSSSYFARIDAARAYFEKGKRIVGNHILMQNYALSVAQVLEKDRSFDAKLLAWFFNTGNDKVPFLIPFAASKVIMHYLARYASDEALIEAIPKMAKRTLNQFLAALVRFRRASCLDCLIPKLSKSDPNLFRFYHGCSAKHVTETFSFSLEFMPNFIKKDCLWKFHASTLVDVMERECLKSSSILAKMDLWRKFVVFFGNQKFPVSKLIYMRIMKLFVKYPAVTVTSNTANVVKEMDRNGTLTLANQDLKLEFSPFFQALKPHLSKSFILSEVFRPCIKCGLVLFRPLLIELWSHSNLLTSTKTNEKYLNALLNVFRELVSSVNLNSSYFINFAQVLDGDQNHFALKLIKLFVEACETLNIPIPELLDILHNSLFGLLKTPLMENFEDIFKVANIGEKEMDLILPQSLLEKLINDYYWKAGESFFNAIYHCLSSKVKRLKKVTMEIEQGYRSAFSFLDTIIFKAFEFISKTPRRHQRHLRGVNIRNIISFIATFNKHQQLFSVTAQGLENLLDESKPLAINFFMQISEINDCGETLAWCESYVKRAPLEQSYRFLKNTLINSDLIPWKDHRTFINMICSMLKILVDRYCQTDCQEMSEKINEIFKMYMKAQSYKITGLKKEKKDIFEIYNGWQWIKYMGKCFSKESVVSPKFNLSWIPKEIVPSIVHSVCEPLLKGESDPQNPAFMYYRMLLSNFPRVSQVTEMILDVLLAEKDKLAPGNIIRLFDAREKVSGMEFNQSVYSTHPFESCIVNNLSVFDPRVIGFYKNLQNCSNDLTKKLSVIQRFISMGETQKKGDPSKDVYSDPYLHVIKIVYPILKRVNWTKDERDHPIFDYFRLKCYLPTSKDFCSLPERKKVANVQILQELLISMLNDLFEVDPDRFYRAIGELINELNESSLPTDTLLALGYKKRCEEGIAAFQSWIQFGIDLEKLSVARKANEVKALKECAFVSIFQGIIDSSSKASPEAVRAFHDEVLLRIHANLFKACPEELVGISMCDGESSIGSELSSSQFERIKLYLFFGVKFKLLNLPSTRNAILTVTKYLSSCIGSSSDIFEGRLIFAKMICAEMEKLISKVSLIKTTKYCSDPESKLNLNLLKMLMEVIWKFRRSASRKDIAENRKYVRQYIKLDDLVNRDAMLEDRKEKLKRKYICLSHLLNNVCVSALNVSIVRKFLMLHDPDIVLKRVESELSKEMSLLASGGVFTICNAASEKEIINRPLYLKNITSYSLLSNFSVNFICSVFKKGSDDCEEKPHVRRVYAKRWANLPCVSMSDIQRVLKESDEMIVKQTLVGCLLGSKMHSETPETIDIMFSLDDKQNRTILNLFFDTLKCFGDRIEGQVLYSSILSKYLRADVFKNLGIASLRLLINFFLGSLEGVSCIIGLWNSFDDFHSSVKLEILRALMESVNRNYDSDHLILQSKLWNAVEGVFTRLQRSLDIADISLACFLNWMVKSGRSAKSSPFCTLSNFPNPCKGMKPVEIINDENRLKFCNLMLKLAANAKDEKIKCLALTSLAQWLLLDISLDEMIYGLAAKFILESDLSSDEIGNHLEENVVNCSEIIHFIFSKYLKKSKKDSMSLPPFIKPTLVLNGLYETSASPGPRAFSSLQKLDIFIRESRHNEFEVMPQYLDEGFQKKAKYHDMMAHMIKKISGIMKKRRDDEEEHKEEDFEEEHEEEDYEEEHEEEDYEEEHEEEDYEHEYKE